MELLQVPLVMLMAALIYLPAVWFWRTFRAERIRRRLLETQLRRLSRELGESELQLWELRSRMKAAEREIRELERGFRGPRDGGRDALLVARREHPAPGYVLSPPMKMYPGRNFVPTVPNIPAAAPVNPRFKYVKGE